MSLHASQNQLFPFDRLCFAPDTATSSGRKTLSLFDRVNSLAASILNNQDAGQFIAATSRQATLDRFVAICKEQQSQPGATEWLKKLEDLFGKYNLRDDAATLSAPLSFKTLVIQLLVVTKPENRARLIEGLHAFPGNKETIRDLFNDFNLIQGPDLDPLDRLARLRVDMAAVGSAADDSTRALLASQANNTRNSRLAESAEKLDRANRATGVSSSSGGLMTTERLYKIYDPRNPQIFHVCGVDHIDSLSRLLPEKFNRREQANLDQENKTSLEEAYKKAGLSWVADPSAFETVGHALEEDIRRLCDESDSEPEKLPDTYKKLIEQRRLALEALQEQVNLLAKERDVLVELYGPNGPAEDSLALIIQGGGVNRGWFKRHIEALEQSGEKVPEWLTFTLSAVSDPFCTLPESERTEYLRGLVAYQMRNQRVRVAPTFAGLRHDYRDFIEQHSLWAENDGVRFEKFGSPRELVRGVEAYVAPATNMTPEALRIAAEATVTYNQAAEVFAKCAPLLRYRAQENRRSMETIGTSFSETLERIKGFVADADGRLLDDCRRSSVPQRLSEVIPGYVLSHDEWAAAILALRLESCSANGDAYYRSLNAKDFRRMVDLVQVAALKLEKLDEALSKPGIASLISGDAELSEQLKAELDDQHKRKEIQLIRGEGYSTVAAYDQTHALPVAEVLGRMQHLARTRRGRFELASAWCLNDLEIRALQAQGVIKDRRLSSLGTDKTLLDHFANAAQAAKLTPAAEVRDVLKAQAALRSPLVTGLSSTTRFIAEQRYFSPEELTTRFQKEVTVLADIYETLINPFLPRQDGNSEKDLNYAKASLVDLEQRFTAMDALVSQKKFSGMVCGWLSKSSANGNSSISLRVVPARDLLKLGAITVGTEEENVARYLPPEKVETALLWLDACARATKVDLVSFPDSTRSELPQMVQLTDPKSRNSFLYKLRALAGCLDSVDVTKLMVQDTADGALKIGAGSWSLMPADNHTRRFLNEGLHSPDARGRGAGYMNTNALLVNGTLVKIVNHLFPRLKI